MAPTSTFITTSSRSVNLKTDVVTAESFRLMFGLKAVDRDEVGLATGLIVQFERSARYRFVSSEKERRQGSSEASKKGRILEVWICRTAEVVG
jgi:hypothetical protein